MGGRRHECIGRICAGRPERASLVPLEYEQPIGEHAQRAERRAHFVRHGAEVLADHERLPPHALESEKMGEILERILHIRTFDRRCAARHPEKSH